MVGRLTHRTLLTVLLLGSGLWAGAAIAADDMPVPKSAPRIKVHQQKLALEEARGNRVVTGAAKAIDAERIKVGDTELRLFGVVLPQQNAPHGAETRVALEKILGAQPVSCRIQERDKTFRLLGICKNEQHEDLSLALLQEGWAVVARGSVQDTDYADIYLAAEAKAQLQRLGMWSPTPAETKPVAEAKPEPKSAETKSADPKLAQAAASEKSPLKPEAVKTPAAEPAPAPMSTQPQVPTMLPTETAPATVGPLAQTVSVEPSLAWLWFAGLTPAAVMILFALGQIALRRYEYMQERKALAAALRGELMAARAICISRADTLGYGAEAVSKLSSVWPRLRSTIYQAYVGRIGLLGPDLARRVSSLYGQFADYAQFYAARPNAEAAGKIDNATVQQTLFTIIDHIEDTLGNLQQVEASGQAPRRLLPQRSNLNSARQRFSERSKADKLEYVDAELVEDAIAIKSVMPPKTTETPALHNQPVNKTGESEIEADHPGMIIAAVIKQGADARMTEATLSAITAAHDALKAEEEAILLAAAEEQKHPTAKALAEAEQLAEAEAAAVEQQPVTRKSNTRRGKRQQLPPPPEKVEEPKEEYYDFRSQAVRISK